MRNLVLKDPAPIGGSGDGAVVSESIRLAWRQVRAPIVAPLLQAAVYVCAAMSLMLFVERVYMAVVILCVKVLRRKRYTKYKLDAMKQELEASNSHPMVRLSIGAACGLSWPSDKIIIQVLDDSTDMILRELVELECERWASKGVNVKYETRNSRNGYKAGALREGLKKHYVRECEYVVIFDADFQPEPDFLWRTVPFLLANPELALVQARWNFDSGGWKDRTTVEDMDLAVRASLKGWKFVFVGDLSRVSVWKKFHVIYAFFFVRKIVAHFVTSIFYCIVIPACVLVPEVHLPKFIAIYVPSTITILNAVCTPRSLHLLLFWILFENVMSVHRAKATIIGLLEANRVNEWVVTEKLGTTGKPKPNTKLGRPRSRIGERIHVLELFMGLYLFYCAIYNIMFSHDHFYVYLLFQAGAFFIMGFGCVGTFVPN